MPGAAHGPRPEEDKFIETLTVFALVAGTYASTNFDNLLLLIGWMLSGRLSRQQIFAGYALAAVVVFLFSAVLGQLSAILPIEYIGYLGLIPIFLGLKMLLENFRSGKVVDETQSQTRLGVAGLATTLFSNSVDSVLVLAPLLIDSKFRFDLVIGVSYVIVVLAWYALGYFLHHQASRLKWISKAARWLAPLIMIAVGAYIIDNTVTDIVAGQ